MRCFLNLFFSEAKRFFTRWKMLGFAFIFLVSTAAVSDGIAEYMSILKENREFHEAEALRVKNLLNYTDYSKDGIEVSVIPAAAGIFFSSPPILSGLSGRVNSVGVLEIAKNCKGKAIFNKETYSRFRFSVIVLLIGSLVALFMGAGPMNKREYLKFLSTQWSGRRVKYSILFSRYILLILAFTVLSVSMVGVAVLNGISFTAGRLLDRMKELAASGALVVYLTGTEMEPPGEDREDKCCDDGEEWMYRVEAKRRSWQNQKSKNREDGTRP